MYLAFSGFLMSLHCICVCTHIYIQIYTTYIYVHTYLILKGILELPRTRDFPFKLLKEESLDAIAAVGLDRLPQLVNVLKCQHICNSTSALVLKSVK